MDENNIETTHTNMTETEWAGVSEVHFFHFSSA